MITGWYPSFLEPNNGDFVREQVRILRRGGLSMDVVYADLNIAYYSKFQFSVVDSIELDQYGNKTCIRSGPFWPKNNPWGLKKWVHAYVAYIHDYIDKYGAPNLIYAHTYLGAIVALELQDDISIPYIVTEHYTGWMDGSIRKQHRSLGIDALNGAKKVFCVSRALKEVIEPSVENEIEVSPNFIDFEVFKPNPHCKTSTFEILGVGDLIPRKQWHNLIKAYTSIYEELPDSKLTIIGDGPLRGALHKLIQSLGMKSYIHLVGSKSKSDVAAAMQRSSTLVHTSHTETFGLIYLEALACELPVISYDNGGVREFRDISGVTILDKSTITNLSRAIINKKNSPSIVDHSELRKNFDGQSKIRECLNIEMGL